MVDFLIGFPVALTQSANKEAVIDGFANTGMIDKKSHKWPDFSAILDTSSVKICEEDRTNIKSTFDKLHAVQVEKGQILESDLDTSLFKEDSYNNPNDAVNRNTETESRQRAKTLNAAWQNKHRLEIKERLHEKTMLKKTRTISNAKNMLLDNNRCEKRLKAIIDDNERNEDEVTDLDETKRATRWRKLRIEDVPVVTIDELKQNENLIADAAFNSCNVGQLKGFCVARKLSFSEFSKRTSTKNIPTKKGLLVKLSIEVKLSKVKLEIPEVDTNTINVTTAAARSQDITEPIVATRQRASTYLANGSWINLFIKAFRGIMPLPPNQPIAQSLMKDADALLDILQSRYNTHFVTHEMQEKKGHQCFKWAECNLPRLSAAMTISTHVRNNLHKISVNRSVTLLANPETSANAIFYNAREEEYKKLEGCYLYYDTENGTWIRSGKAGGDGKSNFGKRDEEHAKAAKKATTSLFYLSYPDESTFSTCARGSWQDLAQYCGLAFDGKEATDIVDVENGLLDWDHVTMEWIERISRDKRSVEHTQLMMVAYLIELVYELSIGMDNNISESGGFEGLAGTFAK